jgi:hypothetical protein
MAMGVVPRELNAAEQGAFVVNCNGVMLLECLLQVFEVGHVRHFDAKVVNNEAECDRLSHVLP